MGHRTTTTASAVALVIATGLCPLVFGGGTAGASGAGGPLRDGNWNGTLAVGATVDFSQEGVELVAEGGGNGTFLLTLTGGTASGEFLLGATSAAVLESADSSGHAEAVGAISGEMQGIATGPILQPLAAHLDVTGSVTVNGITVPFDIPLDVGPEQMLSSTMVISSSSCAIASGTWAQEFQAAIEAAGAAVTSFQGSWAATFVGQNPGATDAALADMLARGEAVLQQWLTTGTFDAEALEQVLIDAEHFAASGPTNDACGSASPGAWASPLSGMVQRLLTAIANSPSTTPETLRFGIAAGLRTNTIPSVPPDTLEASLQAKAEVLLEAAIALNDQAGIYFIAVAADSMGWTEISDAAAAALGA